MSIIDKFENNTVGLFNIDIVLWDLWSFLKNVLEKSIANFGQAY